KLAYSPGASTPSQGRLCARAERLPFSAKIDVFHAGEGFGGTEETSTSHAQLESSLI
ncbi:unnamed protein product, partial [Ectocarpus sp. 12 AP-2014]